MNTRQSISFVLSLLVFTVSSSSIANAATRETRPAEIKVGVTATDLESTYKCSRVTVTQTDKETNHLSFQYTDGHSSSFVTSAENEQGVEYIGTNNGFFSEEPYTWHPNTYSCPPDQFTNIIASPSSRSWFGFADDIFANAIKAFFGLIRTIATWTLGWLTSSLFLVILQQGTFIQSDIVKQGWPFVQGIANLGFVFALLYIALATTLRLESVSTSIQRLLPKLLIGALLVNFSLVIGGLVIDASRLLMAVELNVLTGGQNNNLNLLDQIMQNSKVYSVASLIEKGSTEKASGSFAILLKEFASTVVLVAIALGFGIIALNLFVRYVVLLVLLIFSPLAYLAIALPQKKAHEFFGQWWGMFLKWVLYGPIVLFFLILISKIQSIEFGGDAGTFASIAQFAVVVAMLYIGNIAAKRAAGYGSDAVMGFAKKHPKTSAFTGAAILSGGVGLPIAGALGYGALKYAEKRSGFQEARKIKRAYANKAEKEEAGKKPLVQRAKYRYGTEQYRKEVDVSNAMKTAPTDADVATHTYGTKQERTFDPQNLRTASAGKAIKPEHIAAIIERASTAGDNDDQLQAMINNPTIVGKMEPEHHKDFNAHIESRLSNEKASKGQNAKSTQLLNDYQRSLREVDKKRADDTKTPEDPKK